jgi:hypothetical protein
MLAVLLQNRPDESVNAFLCLLYIGLNLTRPTKRLEAYGRHPLINAKFHKLLVKRGLIQNAGLKVVRDAISGVMQTSCSNSNLFEILPRERHKLKSRKSNRFPITAKQMDWVFQRGYNGFSRHPHLCQTDLKTNFLSIFRMRYRSTICTEIGPSII